MTDVTSSDGTRLARHLDVPTLVAHGTADPEVREDEVRDLLSSLPDAELVSVPGAGHVPPLTHAPLVAEQVARWVARTTPARTPAPQEAR